MMWWYIQKEKRKICKQTRKIKKGIMKMYKKKLIEKMTQMSNNKYCIQMDKKIIVKTSKKVSTKIYKRAKKL